MAFGGPTKIIVGGAATIELPSGTDMGQSKGGVEIFQEQTFFDKTGDQVKTNLDRELVNRRVGVRFELVEASVANLHKALNLNSAQLSGSSISITHNSAAALAAFKATGPAQDAGTRTIILDQVRQVGNIGPRWQKDDDMRLAFELEAMHDPTNNRIGIIGN